ncbi:MAG: PIN domain-containing protein [Deinococcota bacterium]
MKILNHNVSEKFSSAKAVILDTNVIRKNRFLNNVPGKIFLSELKRIYDKEIEFWTRDAAADKITWLPVALIIPEAVEIEVRKRYRKTLEDEYDKVKKALKEIDDLTGQRHKVDVLIPGNEGLEHIFSLSIIPKIDSLNFRQAVSRTSEGIAPAKSKADFIDTLLWLAALEQINDQTEVWLVTEDKGFTDNEAILRDEFELEASKKLRDHFRSQFRLFKSLWEVNKELKFTRPFTSDIDLKSLEQELFWQVQGSFYLDDIISLASFNLASVKIQSIYQPTTTEDVSDQIFLIAYSGFAKGVGLGMRPWDLVGGLSFEFNGTATYNDSTKKFIEFEDIHGVVKDNSFGYPERQAYVRSY